MPTFAQANKAVAELVKRFKQNPPKNETSTRVQFINPFNATDRKIDELVYKLYGLTEKEIRIVEDGIK